ncbi:unnamed protein product [Prorocentrum cordatum]|uniref:Prokaryotic-type class I peptide chain release factors domain-containing protein n=1 Tax=Prorocentrum cordatum TaxID=2364126 RepID=A0ABN9VZP2_9DINO|nr:unnamed protein product [Polarella glacialis]
MRSSGPGGQSVNMSDSKVQLSFNFNDADWLPEPVKAKMRQLFKKRVSKSGEFAVKCQVTSSQIENTALAVQMIRDSIEQAQRAIKDDEREANKIDNREWVIEKMKKTEEGVKRLEKKAEAIKKIKQDRKMKNRENKWRD